MQSMPISEYYSKLPRYCDEVYCLDGLADCSCGAMGNCTCKVLKKIWEMEWKAKAIDFLMGRD